MVYLKQNYKKDVFWQNYPSERWLIYWTCSSRAGLRCAQHRVASSLSLQCSVSSVHRFFTHYSSFAPPRKVGFRCAQLATHFANAKQPILRRRQGGAGNRCSSYITSKCLLTLTYFFSGFLWAFFSVFLFSSSRKVTSDPSGILSVISGFPMICSTKSKATAISR
jgi:hypothetical protein